MNALLLSLCLLASDDGRRIGTAIEPPPPAVIRPCHMEGKWMEKWDRGEDLNWIAEYQRDGKCSHFNQDNGQSWKGHWWMDNTGALHLMETMDGMTYEGQRVQLTALTRDLFRGRICVEMRRRR